MNLRLKGKIIEKFRTQGDFADFIEIREYIVSRVVTGRKTLSVEDQIRWADALNCQREEVFQEA